MSRGAESAEAAATTAARPGPVWAPATATGVGSLPGTDVTWAAGVVFDGLPLPFLPELPERGPGGDIVGRGAGLLADLPVDLQPSGWRLIARPGRDSSRTSDLLKRDLDAFEEAGAAWTGPIKLQACGPWTLAAGLEMTRGGQALADPGAVHDLSESLAEGLRIHISSIRSRLPRAERIYLQLDEPSLPAIARGRIRTASGFATLRTPDSRELTSVLQEVLRADPDVIAGVHCCAPDVPVRLLQQAGARFIGLDATSLAEGPLDEELGEALEAGVGLLAGAVPSVGPLPSAALTTAPLRALWRRLGFPADSLATVAVSPSCGMPGRSPDAARGILRRAREAAEELTGG